MTTTMQIDPERFETVVSQVGQTLTILAGMQVNINSIIGPPSLEQRLTDYVDKRDDHKTKGLEELIVNQRHLTELELKNTRLEIELKMAAQSKDILEAKLIAEMTEKNRLKDHAENLANQSKTNRKVDRLQNLSYIAYGVLLAAQAYLVYVVKK